MNFKRQRDFSQYSFDFLSAFMEGFRRVVPPSGLNRACLPPLGYS